MKDQMRKEKSSYEEVLKSLYESGIRNAQTYKGFIDSFKEYNLDSHDIAIIIAAKIKSDTEISKYEIEAYMNSPCDCNTDDDDIT